MKYRYSFLIFLAAFIVQGSLLNLIAVFNITPNLILCLVVMFSFLYNNQYHAIIYGTLFGMLYDMCFMHYTGTTALGYFLIAVMVLALSRVLNRENEGTAVVLIIISTLLFVFYSFFINMFMGGSTDILYLLTRLPVLLIYNGLTSMGLYQIFIRKVVRFRNDRYYSGYR